MPELNMECFVARQKSVCVDLHFRRDSREPLD